MLKKLKDIQRYRSYKEVFETKDGRVVLADMCRAHGVFDGGFDPDPYEHARMAGERNSVLRILTILNLTSAEIAELSKED